MIYKDKTILELNRLASLFICQFNSYLESKDVFVKEMIPMLTDDGEYPNGCEINEIIEVEPILKIRKNNFFEIYEGIAIRDISISWAKNLESFFDEEIKEKMEKLADKIIPLIKHNRLISWPKQIPFYPFNSVFLRDKDNKIGVRITLYQEIETMEKAIMFEIAFNVPESLEKIK